MLKKNHHATNDKKNGHFYFALPSSRSACNRFCKHATTRKSEISFLLFFPLEKKEKMFSDSFGVYWCSSTIEDTISNGPCEAIKIAIKWIIHCMLAARLCLFYTFLLSSSSAFAHFTYFYSLSFSWCAAAVEVDSVANCYKKHTHITVSHTGK